MESGRRELIAWSIVALISALAFAFLLWGVLAHNGLTSADLPLATYVAGHRLAWLTTVMQLVTWVGSSFFIIPLGVIVGGVLWRRRRTWRPLVMMSAAFLGAAALYDIVKPAVGRARPAAALQVGGPDEGWAFRPDMPRKPSPSTGCRRSSSPPGMHRTAACFSPSAPRS